MSIIFRILIVRVHIRQFNGGMGFIRYKFTSTELFPVNYCKNRISFGRICFCP